MSTITTRKTELERLARNHGLKPVFTTVERPFGERVAAIGFQDLHADFNEEPRVSSYGMSLDEAEAALAALIEREGASPFDDPGTPATFEDLSGQYMDGLRDGNA